MSTIFNLKKLFILVSLVALSSCNGRISEGGAIELTPSSPSPTQAPVPAPAPAPLRSEDITFQMVQNQVLNQSCLMCHSKAAGNLGGINLETYQSVFPVRANIRDEVVTKGMPLAPAHPLTDAQAELIVRWIDAGAKNI